MLSHDEWVERLERQAANLDALERQIAEHQERGESTVYARSALKDGVREHRAALSRAPLDVLLYLGASRAFSEHL